MKVPERLLFGPGPSPVSSRVMQAMAAPVLSHLDPVMITLLDKSAHASRRRSAPETTPSAWQFPARVRRPWKPRSPTSRNLVPVRSSW
jgi:hypothetical protein